MPPAGVKRPANKFHQFLERQMKIATSVIATMLLGVTAAAGQDSVAPGAPPNACELLGRTDLQVLLPDAEVTKSDENLSPLFRGQQYVASCLYRVDLDGAAGDGPRPYVSLAVVRWQGATQATNSPEEGMDDLLTEFGETQPSPPKALEAIGDEAFSMEIGQEFKVYARRADLIFQVSVDANFPEAPDVATRAAALAAGRWGSSDETTEVSAAPIDVTAPVEDVAKPNIPVWPNACEILPEQDVTQAWPQAELVDTQAMSGSIRFDTGEEVALPEPMGCWYTLRRAGDGSAVITHQVQLTLENVLADAEAASDYFELSLEVSGEAEPVDGIGTAAAIDPRNKITVQEGNVVFHLRVTGGETDAVLHEQAAAVAKNLAASVAARLAE
jgi:hypothetical protein